MSRPGPVRPRRGPLPGSRPVRKYLASLVVFALAGPAVVIAQPAPPAMGPSFMVIRYSSAASLTFYGGYRLGPAVGFVGFVQNPRSTYREALAGLGATVSSGRQSALIGLAAAHASDGWYGQLYLLPDLRLGRFELSGTLEVYQPAESRGAHQFYTTPLNLFYLPGSGVAVGLTYLVSAQTGIPDGHTLGPSVRVAIPKGSIRVDLPRRVAVAPPEVRITFTTNF